MAITIETISLTNKSSRGLQPTNAPIQSIHRLEPFISKIYEISPLSSKFLSILMYDISIRLKQYDEAHMRLSAKIEKQKKEEIFFGTFFLVAISRLIP
ncbi:hypothetical protein BLOT_000811 [Blomia tropicalis]|nr:hypothetical protein BLOT_000811 [Blomia tropicalis]